MLNHYWTSSTRAGKAAIIGAGLLAGSWLATFVYRIWIAECVGSLFETVLILATIYFFPLVALTTLICSIIEIVRHEHRHYAPIAAAALLQVGQFFYMVELIVSVYGA